MAKTRFIPLLSFIIIVTIGTWWLYALSSRRENDDTQELWTPNSSIDKENPSSLHHDKIVVEASSSSISTEQSASSPAAVSKTETGAPPSSSSINTNQPASSITTSKKDTNAPTPSPKAVFLTPDPLGVEQIDADFPGTYVNKNNWFRQPTAPTRKEAEDLLNKEEWSLLPTFKELGFHTSARVKKIESFYGMGANWTWRNHVDSLDDEVNAQYFC